MVEIFGKNYYIDLDRITERCRTGKTIKDEDGDESLEVNLFKYETIKMCLDRVLYENEEVDEDLGLFGNKNVSISFKLAFNTLIKYEIIIEEDDE